MAVKENTISIPKLEKEYITVTIRGVTPLIVHRFSLSVQRAIEEAQQGAAKLKKAPRTPDKEFDEAIYRTADGGHGFPAIGVKKAMVTAGQRFGDEKGTELFGSFSIPVELLRIDTAHEPVMRSDRVVLSGMSRTSSIAYRPMYEDWGMDVPIWINAGFVSPDQIVNLLNIAGFGVGIGDWRVEKKGTFGQFEVARVAATK